MRFFILLQIFLVESRRLRRTITNTLSHSSRLTQLRRETGKIFLAVKKAEFFSARFGAEECGCRRREWTVHSKDLGKWLETSLYRSLIHSSEFGLKTSKFPTT